MKTNHIRKEHRPQEISRENRETQITVAYRIFADTPETGVHQGVYDIQKLGMNHRNNDNHDLFVRQIIKFTQPKLARQINSETQYP